MVLELFFGVGLVRVVAAHTAGMTPLRGSVLFLD